MLRSVELALHSASPVRSVRCAVSTAFGRGHYFLVLRLPV